MATPNDRPSKILLEEYYASEDNRFLDCFRQFQAYETLKHFVQRWLADHRPWARSQLIAYIDGTLNSAGHEVVVKQAFKHAEAHGDTERLAHFLVAFDRLVRRNRIDRYSYDWKTRQFQRHRYLLALPNRVQRAPEGRTPRSTHRLFSQQTRAYLRRRVWRFFRHLSYRDPVAYTESIVQALALYRDEDFAAGENLLDNWSLMHACYYHHDAVQFGVAHTNVSPGQSLANLHAAPYQPTAWQHDSAGGKLWQLLASARSNLVRVWTIECLQRFHPALLTQVPLGQLVELLAHRDPTIQAFAVGLFSQHAALPTLELEQWLELIEQADIAVLPEICQAMKTHVAQQRLSDKQLIRMTCAAPVPVATVGLEMLKSRHAASSLSPEQIEELSAAKCASLAEQVSAWALEQLSIEGNYSAQRVIGFFDALLEPVRKAACRWLLGESSPGRSDPALWAKLAETPADDVRFALLELIKPLARRGVSIETHSRFSASLDSDVMGRVWSAVVLCVHRGSRAKPKAIEQLAAAVRREPALADQYLPVLAFAVRSVRSPERRAALAALASLVAQRPDLQPSIERHVPELNLTVDGTA